jgi:hypothetical protein
VAVEVERVVDAAVEHVVEDEVHRVQLRQQEALHAARMAVCELACDRRLGDLLDQQVPEARHPTRSR